jgi:GNAT superfamily N-acetyltransferase
VSEVKIREANISDATSIAKLSGQLGYPATPEELRDRLLSILQKKKHKVYVAELPDKSVIGWIHVFGTQYLMAEPLVEVGGLIVDESNRGHGIGRALVETAEGWAITMGYRYLRIRSNTIRTEAHRFYEKMGYNCAKTSFVLVKPLVYEHSDGEVCV